jgi:hypothetical protein
VRRGRKEKWAYRFVEAPRLQQRSEKREATMPMRKKMSVVTRNPIVDELARVCLPRARWDAGGISHGRTVGLAGGRCDTGETTRLEKLVERMNWCWARHVRANGS